MNDFQKAWEILLEIASSHVEHSYGVGEVIISEGAYPPNLLLLVSGSVEIRRGDTLITERQGPSILGEIGWFDEDCPSTAEVVISEPAIVKAIPYPDLDRELSYDSDKAMTVVREMAKLTISRVLPKDGISVNSKLDKSWPFLTDLGSEETGRTYKEGERILREGSFPPFLTLLVNGKVKIIRQGVEITELEAPTILGEVGWFDKDSPCTAEVVVEDLATVRRVDFIDLDRELGLNGDRALNVSKELARLTITREFLAECALIAPEKKPVEVKKAPSKLADPNAFETMIATPHKTSMGVKSAWDLLLDIASRNFTRSYEDGNVILSEGSFPPNMILLLEGELEIKRAGQTVATVSAPEIIGEVGWFDEEFPSTAGVVAKGQVTIKNIPYSDLDRELMFNSEKALIIGKDLGRLTLRRTLPKDTRRAASGLIDAWPTLRAFTADLEEIEFKDGEEVLPEGGFPPHLSLIMSGYIKVIRGGVEIAEVHSPTVIGEVGWFDEDTPSTATIVASGNVITKQLGYKNLDLKITEDADEGLGVIKGLASLMLSRILPNDESKPGVLKEPIRPEPSTVPVLAASPVAIVAKVNEAVGFGKEPAPARGLPVGNKPALKPEGMKDTPDAVSPPVVAPASLPPATPPKTRGPIKPSSVSKNNILYESWDILLELTENAPEQVFQPGNTIIPEGGFPPNLWIITSGVVEIRALKYSVVQIKAPTVLGEVRWFNENSESTAEVVAVDEVKLKSISYMELDIELRSDGQKAMTVARDLGKLMQLRSFPGH